MCVRKILVPTKFKNNDVVISFYIFRDTYDVKDITNPSSLAFTNRPLQFHTDQPYYRTPPDVSFLPCNCYIRSG